MWEHDYFLGQSRSNANPQYSRNAINSLYGILFWFCVWKFLQILPDRMSTIRQRVPSATEQTTEESYKLRRCVIRHFNRLLDCVTVANPCHAFADRLPKTPAIPFTDSGDGLQTLGFG